MTTQPQRFSSRTELISALTAKYDLDEADVSRVVDRGWAAMIFAPLEVATISVAEETGLPEPAIRGILADSWAGAVHQAISAKRTANLVDDEGLLDVMTKIM